MYPIISITGKAGSGKNSFATLIAQSYGQDKVKLISFADPLKNLARDLFGIEEELLFGPSEGRATELDSDKSAFWDKVENNLRNPLFTNQLLTLFGKTDPFAVAVPKATLFSLIKDMRNQYQGAFTRLTVRKVLQELGTTWGRAVDPGVWINFTKNVAANHLRNGADLVIITDTRFRNEVLALKDVGAIMVKIEATGRGASMSHGESTHVSETSQDSIPSFWFDWRITNDKTKGMKTLMQETSLFMDEFVYYVKNDARSNILR